MKGLLGRKVGMTQVFTEEGLLVPVTVIEVVPNVVLQKKTLENDGYEAVQLGIEDVKLQRATKPQIGHAKKVGSAPKKFVREIAGNALSELELGSVVKADLFAPGDIVDVQGTSKGKGFTGAIVRNNQKMGPASHGSGHHRGIGSLATIGRNNGIINKGRIMAGQEGGYTTTNRNLEVVKVDAENNYILVRGNVPGPRKGYVIVKTTTKRVKQVTPKTLINRGEGQGE
ncbi:MAG: 50S ribosomal protein L3 [Erysipelothrix sp.]|nr:50S ribosomal protein L3 [Erysipelothrix sp.]